MYDVEVPYPLPLKLGLGDRPQTTETIDVANAGTASINDLILYQPDKRALEDDTTVPEKSMPPMHCARRRMRPLPVAASASL